jgi:hypothetical protein
MIDIVNYLYLGIDSFVVCIGFGALNRSRWIWPLLAASFGIADAFGTMLGGIFGQAYHGPPPHLVLVASAGVAAYGSVVAAATAQMRVLVTNRIGLVLLPLLLSVDNFVAAAMGNNGAASSSSTFLATSVMALLGCLAGAVLIRRWPALKQALAGGTAIATALIMSLA